MKKIALMCAVTLLCGPLFSGDLHWNDKSLRNLDVNVEYFGYSSRNSSGEPIFRMGNLLRYRITVVNRGKRPFKNFPFESTLYWAGSVTCVRTWSDNKTVTYSPLNPLPGLSSSGVRNLTIDPEGGMASYDVSYMITNEVCPNRGEIRMGAGRGGNHDSLILPQRFEIRQ